MNTPLPTEPLYWDDPDDEGPSTLEDAVRDELANLWSDLDLARRNAINTSWSINCGNIAHRIITLSRFVGPTEWESIAVSLLLDGVYERVYGDGGIEYPPIDWVRVREVRARIDARRGSA